MSLKANIAANFIGQGWRALIALAFVPLYIKVLGIEAYGLIGLFVTIQACLSLLDLGLRPALSREMARFTGGSHDAFWIRDFLRSTEIIAAFLALFASVTIALMSGWLARYWVHSAQIADNDIGQNIALMGIAASLQFMESIYSSSIAGLQRQVLLNVLSSLISTVRAVGAVVVITYASPTLEAFFTWQVGVSLLSIGTYAIAVNVILPRISRIAQFSWEAIISVRGYAAGMVGIALLGITYTQVDKLLLIKQIPLDDYGRYILAAAVAGMVGMLGAPIGAAYFPRFTQLAEQNSTAELRAAFRLATQLLCVLVASAVTMLIFYGDRLVFVWTGDAGLSERIAPIASILSIGIAFNSILSIAYLLQLSYGWTGLAVKINIIGVIIMVPAMLVVAPRYGAIGAACVWAILNFSLFLLSTQLMFRRILPDIRGVWLGRDVALPCTIALATGGLLYAIVPRLDARFPEVVVLIIVGGVITLCGILMSAPLRHQAIARFTYFIQRRSATP